MRRVSSTVVQATLGVGSVNFWSFTVAWTRGGKGTIRIMILRLSCFEAVFDFKLTGSWEHFARDICDRNGGKGPRWYLGHPPESVLGPSRHCQPTLTLPTGTPPPPSLGNLTTGDTTPHRTQQPHRAAMSAHTQTATARMPVDKVDLSVHRAAVRCCPIPLLSLLWTWSGLVGLKQQKLSESKRQRPVTVN